MTIFITSSINRYFALRIMSQKGKAIKKAPFGAFKAI